MGCSGYYNNVGNLVSKKQHDLNYVLSAYEYLQLQVLVVTGGYASGVTAPGTEHLEVGVDSTWTYKDYNNTDEISCAETNSEVYCLQGI